VLLLHSVLRRDDRSIMLILATLPSQAVVGGRAADIVTTQVTKQEVLVKKRN
jgi:hypothetical protein